MRFDSSAFYLVFATTPKKNHERITRIAKKKSALDANKRSELGSDGSERKTEEKSFVHSTSS